LNNHCLRLFRYRSNQVGLRYYDLMLSVGLAIPFMVVAIFFVLNKLLETLENELVKVCWIVLDYGGL
jgi:hypothetical protein